MTTKTSTMFPRPMQNYLLIWLNSSTGEDNDTNDQNVITQLRAIINNIIIFNNIDQCIDYLTDVQNEQVFMIVSNNLSEEILSFIHNIVCLNMIFVFTKNKSINEPWTSKYTKIKGIFTEISKICEVLKRTIPQCEQGMIPISFAPVNDIGSKPNLNELDPLFMYTQILKEILLQMTFDEQSVTNFTTDLRKQFLNEDPEVNFIDEFERDYYHHSPIWWYTRPSILYSMLNRALRLMESDIIIKMGFFVRDLHENIKQIYVEQYSDHQNVSSFIVYRGQGLSMIDFNKLRKSEGGLMSFNNFLSTSANRDIASMFADSNQMNSDFIGVLFEITIDPSVSSTPFAPIKDVSYFADPEEEELLFSMHAIFRIRSFKQLNNNNNDRLWEVELTLTSDNDEQLQLLTDQIREEIHGNTSWMRLGRFLMKIDQLEQAEQLNLTLLNQTTTNDKNKGHFYSQLGCIKDEQGYHQEAIELYEKAFEYRQKYLHRNHPEFAIFYHNVGMAYFGMGDYQQARFFYEKSLEICKNTLPENHRDFAVPYGDLALVYFRTGDYAKALALLEKHLNIEEKILVPNHPDLAIIYDNIGATYHSMGKYSTALSFYRKALDIKEKTLPSTHTELASSLSNIGALYDELGQSEQAISFLEKALAMYEKALPWHHEKIIGTYNSMGLAYSRMKNYTEALSFCTKALEISEEKVPLNKHDLVYQYVNIGTIYLRMREYSEALAFYQRALVTLGETPYADQQILARTYNNIAGVYFEMGKPLESLSFVEKACATLRTVVPPEHPSFIACFNNMGGMFFSTKDYSEALVCFKNALEICHKTLPRNHPHLFATYNNIAAVYNAMGEYSQTVFYYMKAHSIKQ